MIRLLALSTVLLAATVGYGAAFLRSEARDIFFALPTPREAAMIAWTQDGSQAVTAHRSPSPPALVFEAGPPLPVVNPYSGTFVTFPLR